MNSNFVPAYSIDEIRDGQSKVFSTKNTKGEPMEIAIFHIDGKFYAISNTCMHKGGPLSKGPREGTIVTCPWHGWKYSVVDGRSPHEGGDSVDSYETKIIDGRVHVNLIPCLKSQRKYVPHKKYSQLASDVEKHLSQLDDDVHQRSSKLRILGISTTNVTERVQRKSTSEELLQFALDYAEKSFGAQTVMLKLRELNFKHCQGYYSIDSRACIFPCSISEVDEEDQMIEIYRRVVLWADVLLISTPIRWGSASSLYYKMVQRMNSVQNQAPTRNIRLIRDKVAAFIITGGQDNVQHVAGEMMSFWSQTGFVFGKYPFVGWSRGWYAEDTQNNVDAMKSKLRDDGPVRNDIVEMVNGAVEMARIVKKAGYDEQIRGHFASA